MYYTYLFVSKIKPFPAILLPNLVGHLFCGLFVELGTAGCFNFGTVAAPQSPAILASHCVSTFTGLFLWLWPGHEGCSLVGIVFLRSQALSLPLK